VSLGRRSRFAGAIGVLLIAMVGSAQDRRVTRYVDCQSHAARSDGSAEAPLKTLGEINALSLKPGDNVLFKRGTACEGELRPQGSGEPGAPIRIGAYAAGALPRIHAGTKDGEALRLFNQSFWEIDSLDLSGGMIQGIFAGGDGASMHHLYLRDLRVHDVRGPLQHKESGLIVVWATGEGAGYDDVRLDGITAFNTTQWSGIFVSGASHVQIRNATVHDVQGDGIVVFHANDAVIARSLAWHTGMQHQLSIGTPNAIWTWRCTDCTVEGNEAFLTDSPGIDGGSFDIDFGNTRNTVRNNFGHDTAGYCVSVFGAFGPTIDSLVEDNLCINNGMSPRLAQRQGALLLMTWQGGSLQRVQFRGNRVYWQPPGVTPALQTGAGLSAASVRLDDNQVWSSGPAFIDPRLAYTGENNRYILVGDDARKQAANADLFGFVSNGSRGWRLEFHAPAWGTRSDDVRGMLVACRSAALQYGHNGLRVVASGDQNFVRLAGDWGMAADGVILESAVAGAAQGFSVRLISPAGRVNRQWTSYPGPVELGLALRQTVGRPNFGFLPMENVRATD
jgi:hypothetical protein